MLDVVGTYIAHSSLPCASKLKAIDLHSSTSRIHPPISVAKMGHVSLMMCREGDVYAELRILPFTFAKPAVVAWR